jgi:hypothetical protein
MSGLRDEQSAHAAVTVAIRRGALAAQAGSAWGGCFSLEMGCEHGNPSSSSSLLLDTSRRGSNDGQTPVAALFQVPPESDILSSLLVRVQETALVSAQGYVGRPVRFSAFRSYTKLHGHASGQALQLGCSVAQGAGSRVVVLSHIVNETMGTEVGCAVTFFEAVDHSLSVRPTTLSGHDFFRDLGKLHRIAFRSLSPREVDVS